MNANTHTRIPDQKPDGYRVAPDYPIPIISHVSLAPVHTLPILFLRGTKPCVPRPHRSDWAGGQHRENSAACGAGGRQIIVQPTPTHSHTVAQLDPAAKLSASAISVPFRPATLPPPTSLCAITACPLSAFCLPRVPVKMLSNWAG